MYTDFYKMNADPFRLSPDHRFCFKHSSYAKSRAYMRYAIDRGEGFAMITGAPGTGKTTLSHDLTESLDPEKVAVGRLVSTRLAADDLLRMVAFSFGVDVEGVDKATVIRRLEQFLKEIRTDGRRAVIIVDEAQDLSESALEELRLLTNLQFDGEHLVQVLLLGQDDLRDVVRAPAMEQLQQRFIAASHLEPLNEAETHDYVQHRLACVGWENDPQIADTVYQSIHTLSQGIPRRINLVCSRLLLHGCALEKHTLDRDDVMAVAQELHNEMLTPLDDSLQTDYSGELADLGAPSTFVTPGYEPGTVDSVSPGAQVLDFASANAAQLAPDEDPQTLSAVAQPGLQATPNGFPVTQVEPEATEVPSFRAVERGERQPEPAAPIRDIEHEEPLAQPRERHRGTYTVIAAFVILIVVAVYAVDPRVMGPVAVDVKAWLIRTFPSLSESLSDPPAPTEPVVDSPPPQSPLDTPTAWADRPATTPEAPQVAATEPASPTLAASRPRDTDASGPGTLVTAESPESERSVESLEALQLSDTEAVADAPARPANPSGARTGGAPETDAANDTGLAASPPSERATSPRAVSEASRAATPEVALEPFDTNEETSAVPRAPEFLEDLQLKGYRAIPDARLEQALRRVAPVRRMPGNVLWVSLDPAHTFGTASTDLDPGLRRKLDELAATLARRQSVVVGLVGHSDSTGSESVNELVARERAGAVAGYLIRAGVSRSRIYTEGRGSSEPRASNATQEGRRLNRRVEIFVIPVAPPSQQSQLTTRGLPIPSKPRRPPPALPVEQPSPTSFYSPLNDSP